MDVLAPALLALAALAFAVPVVLRVRMDERARQRAQEVQGTSWWVLLGQVSEAASAGESAVSLRPALQVLREGATSGVRQGALDGVLARIDLDA